MTGRTHRAERRRRGARVEPLDRCQARTGTEQCGFPRSRAHARVRIDATSTARTQPLERVEVQSRVNAFELDPRGKPGVYKDEILSDPRPLRAFEHRIEA